MARHRGLVRRGSRVRVGASGARRAWRRSLQLRMVTYTLVAFVAPGRRVRRAGRRRARRAAWWRLGSSRRRARSRNGSLYAQDQLSQVTQSDDPQLHRRHGQHRHPALDGVRPGRSDRRSWPRRAPRRATSRSIRPPAAPPTRSRRQLEAYVTGQKVRAHQFVVGADRQRQDAPAGAGRRHAGRSRRASAPTASTTSTRSTPRPRRRTSPATRSSASASGLIVLLAIIVWLVTRLVVRPVRLAARTAQRLSAGLLDQRMEVSGEDDLAMLGRLVQPDGGQPATPDRAAGRHVPAAAAVHLRRLARAAYAADHRPHGRRSDLHEPRRVRSADGPQRRAAAQRTRPVRGAADRPAGDQPLRRRIRRARRGADRSGARGRPRRRPAGVAGRAGRRHVDLQRARRPGHRRGRPAPGRADPAQPGRQRGRAQRGPARSSSRSRPTTPPSRSPSATTASACVRARRSWSSTGSGEPTRPGRGRPAAPASACRSAWKTPVCTAAGWRRGARRARVPSSGWCCRCARAVG